MSWPCWTNGAGRRPQSPDHLDPAGRTHTNDHTESVRPDFRSPGAGMPLPPPAYRRRCARAIKFTATFWGRPRPQCWGRRFRPCCFNGLLSQAPLVAHGQDAWAFPTTALVEGARKQAGAGGPDSRYQLTPDLSSAPGSDGQAAPGAGDASESDRTCRSRRTGSRP